MDCAVAAALDAACRSKLDDGWSGNGTGLYDPWLWLYLWRTGFIGQHPVWDG
jgi:hypothetical protein